MIVGEYDLVHEGKLRRAIEGTVVSGGKVLPGVGPEASDAEIVAEYDRLGGLIRKDGLKVKTGCFYDFEEKKAFEKPELSFEISIDESIVDVSEAEAKALDSAKRKRNELKAQAKDKPKKKPLRRRKKVKEEGESGDE